MPNEIAEMDPNNFEPFHVIPAMEEYDPRCKREQACSDKFPGAPRLWCMNCLWHKALELLKDCDRYHV